MDRAVKALHQDIDAGKEGFFDVHIHHQVHRTSAFCSKFVFKIKNTRIAFPIEVPQLGRIFII
jgi:hypothetical protein